VEWQQAAGQGQLVDDYIAVHYIQQEQEQEELKKEYLQEQEQEQEELKKDYLQEQEQKEPKKDYFQEQDLEHAEVILN